MFQNKTFDARRRFCRRDHFCLLSLSMFLFCFVLLAELYCSIAGVCVTWECLSRVSSMLSCLTEAECKVVAAAATATAAGTSKATAKTAVRALELEELAEHLLRVNVARLLQILNVASVVVA